jgi:hypothetical protein
MIPQMSPEVYGTYFNYFVYGHPPITHVSLACEFCHSKDLVMQQHETKREEKPLCFVITHKMTFFCPYCLHIEQAELKSTVLRDITMKDIAESLKEA